MSAACCSAPHTPMATNANVTAHHWQRCKMNTTHSGSEPPDYKNNRAIYIYIYVAHSLCWWKRNIRALCALWHCAWGSPNFCYKWNSIIKYFGYRMCDMNLHHCCRQSSRRWACCTAHARAYLRTLSAVFTVTICVVYARRPLADANASTQKLGHHKKIPLNAFIGFLCLCKKRCTHARTPSLSQTHLH